MTDIVDDLVGAAPGSPLAAVRERRPETKDQVQASYDALFSSGGSTDLPVAERLLIAAFATALGGDDPVSAHFAALAREADAERAALVIAEAEEAATSGPYGSYTEAGLQQENTEGPVYRADGVKERIGERLAAALEHVHLLTFRPRESSAAALDDLLSAGWSVDGIVTLSQLVAYLAFQQRIVAGLRVLAEEASA